ncbi:HupE/UreJ family protein [Wenxinia marina]|uniref:HupE / UreJ protein n=1 Tax=Wenxinia marina DSM 24838 TaxID=1123501 RepID=A0A0D0P833_9RHOB|nr:HupE/UreJ family protein [Wenxinia marina]KIQ67696.1 HupE / UreJ protein [Wenxinia marina DSM 24838]GGL77861.1 hypothetical protein GCM10011392_35510 [Wenxinia marina]
MKTLRLAASLWLALALSSLAVAARAHEVLPAIADMELTEDGLVFDVEVNAEGILAGIDLSAVEDTNAAPEAATYDELRALPADELEARTRAAWQDLAGDIHVRAGGEDLPLELTGVAAGEVGDVSVLRPTTISFRAALPPGADAVTVGWDRRLGALVIRQQGVEEPYDGLLEAGETSAPIALGGGNQLGPWETFVAYIPVGFDHIVPLGLDHILFVLGLFFLSTRLGPLLWQVSAFTVAHTITLALSSLGYVSIPAYVVEPIIAASIVFVALENIWSRGLSVWRPLVVFLFGLLHGLGFASVLSQFGLPSNAFLPALIGFNIGVELGQLFVILVAFLIVREAVRIDEGRDEVRFAKDLYILLPGIAIGAAFLWMAVSNPEVPPLYFGIAIAALSVLCWISVKNRDQLDAYRRIVAVPASAAIAVIGAYWVIERTLL